MRSEVRVLYRPLSSGCAPSVRYYKVTTVSFCCAERKKRGTLAQDAGGAFRMAGVTGALTGSTCEDSMGGALTRCNGCRRCVYGLVRRYVSTSVRRDTGHRARHHGSRRRRGGRVDGADQRVVVRGKRSVPSRRSTARK